MARLCNVKKIDLFVWDIYGNSHGKFEYSEQIAKKLNCDLNDINRNLKDEPILIKKKYFVSYSSKFELHPEHEKILHEQKKRELHNRKWLGVPIKVTSNTGNQWEFSSIRSAGRHVRIPEEKLKNLFEEKEVLELNGYKFEKVK